MVIAFVTVAHLAQAYFTGGVLQLTVAVGGAGEAVEGVIGDIQLHHIATQVGDFFGLRVDHHAVFRWRGARGRVALATLNFNHAHAARAVDFEAVGSAELGHFNTGFGSGAHHRGALGH